MATPPILDNKHPASPSVFAPEALLREARRQKKLDDVPVPPMCLLDPDGDIVRRLRQTGRARPFAPWACYHTELDVFDLGGHEVGIVGRAHMSGFSPRRSNSVALAIRRQTAAHFSPQKSESSRASSIAVDNGHPISPTKPFASVP